MRVAVAIGALSLCCALSAPAEARIRGLSAAETWKAAQTYMRQEARGADADSWEVERCRRRGTWALCRATMTTTAADFGHPEDWAIWTVYPVIRARERTLIVDDPLILGDRLVIARRR